MAGKRKVTPEVEDTIVTEWLKWQLGHYPDVTLYDHLTSRVPVGIQQAYKYIPEHIKKATREEMRKYLEQGWRTPLDLRHPMPAIDPGAHHFLELWAAADADAKAARLQVERMQATIQAVLDMDKTLSRETRAALKSQLT